MSTSTCLGRNLDEHCCWIAGKVCEFLEENTEKGFRWSCGLRRELGSWDAVITDPRYLDGPAKESTTPNMNCRDWPSPSAGGPCKLCGGGNDSR